MSTDDIKNQKYLFRAYLRIFVMMIRPYLSNSFVACNIYVSAGRSQHSDVLMKILLNAQKQCRSMPSTNVAVAHAFADGPYDRSSFHLAGDADAITEVASTIATSALNELETTSNHVELERSRHPFVGMVDHIAVMPLNKDVSERAEDSTNTTRDSPNGNAAKAIGRRLEALGLRVYYYGDAHAEKKSLARVRREETNFFKTVIPDDEHLASLKSDKGKATIGAPSKCPILVQPLVI